ncbi:MAG: hypothetical protein RIR37_1272 [Verrucomicrobiota bacterium]
MLSVRAAFVENIDQRNDACFVSLLIAQKAFFKWRFGCNRPLNRQHRLKQSFFQRKVHRSCDLDPFVFRNFRQWIVAVFELRNRSSRVGKDACV